MPLPGSTTIQLDPVSAYYHIPPIWVGTSSVAESSGTSATASIHCEVLRRTLSAGIGVRVRRDGLFTFDFYSFFPVPSVDVAPVIEKPSPPVAKEFFVQIQDVVDVIYRRVEVMNA